MMKSAGRYHTSNALMASRCLLLAAAVCVAPMGASAVDPAYASAVVNPFGINDLGAGNEYAAIEMVDINGDGDLDAFMGAADGITRFFRNTGNSTNPAFEAPVTNPFGLTTTGTYTQLAFGDINGDGDFDLFVGNQSGNIYFVPNNGNSAAPTFGSRSTNPFGLSDIGTRSCPELVDLDGDGDLDLFCTRNDDDNARFFQNTGTATLPAFAAPVQNPFNLSPSGLATAHTFADVDGDLDLDVLGGSSTFRFRRNTGNSTNPAFSSEDINPFNLTTGGLTGYSHVAFADIDKDLDFDLMLSSFNGTTRFYQNTSPIDVTPPTVAITRLGSTTTGDSAVLFNVDFNEPVSPTFTVSDITLTGALASNCFVMLGEPNLSDVYIAYVVPKDPAAAGTLGISITGSVLDRGTNPLSVPQNSPLFTIGNFPPGDVSKNGTFDLGDVALLADANLSLTTLP